MTSKSRKAQLPFASASKYINVNAFGSNIAIRWAGVYFEIDIFGRNVPLPGVSRKNNTKKVVLTDGQLLDGAQEPFYDLETNLRQPPKSTADQLEYLHRHRIKMKKRELRLWINQNFDPASAQLVTADFSDCFIEYTTAAEHFRRFRHELQRKVPDIRFLSVIETGNTNKYHLHMVTDRKLPITPFEAKEYVKNGIIKSRAGALNVLWPHGDIHQKALNGGGHLGAGLSNYLTKTAISSEMKFKHTINKSRNLTPYVTMRGDNALAFIERVVVSEKLEEFYSYTCEGLEHIDYMHHYEFSLDPEKMLLYPKKAGKGQTLKLIA